MQRYKQNHVFHMHRGINCSYTECKALQIVSNYGPVIVGGGGGSQVLPGSPTKMGGTEKVVFEGTLVPYRRGEGSRKVSNI